MNRREFVRQMGLGLAAGWALGPWAWPFKAWAVDGPPRLALLADAHLKDGDPRRPEAQALMRAVAEIRAVKPPPDAVLFAGDLAHDGRADALALGRDILADLPEPLFMVMGEGDGPAAAGGPWPRLFGDPWFYQASGLRRQASGVRHREALQPASSDTENRKQKAENRLQILGIHTGRVDGPYGPAFRVGDAGRAWLAQVLARLDPDLPLIVLSHAPLGQIFRPWRQWTVDAAPVLAQLSRFRQVLCLHGHVHEAGGRRPAPGLRPQGNQLIWPESAAPGPNMTFLTENRKQKTENRLLHQGLPATAWPLPNALTGTPAQARPGLGPYGCGWGLITLGTAASYHPHIWQA